MNFKIGNVKFTITLPFTIVLTAVFLFDKTGLAAPAMLGILLHEAGHLAAMATFKIRVREINLRVGAVEIVRCNTAVSRMRCAAVSLAGSAAGAICGGALYAVFCFSGSTAVANCAVMQFCFAAFNLLPIAGLDGGETAALFLSQTAAKILSAITLTAVLAAGVWLFCRSGGAGLALSAVYLGVMGLAFSKSADRASFRLQ